MRALESLTPELRAATLRALRQDEARALLMLAAVLVHRKLGNERALALLPDAEWVELGKAANLDSAQMIRFRTEVRAILISEGRKIGTLSDVKGAPAPLEPPSLSATDASRPFMDSSQHSTQSLSQRAFARSNPKVWGGSASSEASSQATIPNRTLGMGAPARAADRTWSPRNASNGTTHWAATSETTRVETYPAQDALSTMQAELVALNVENRAQKAKLKQQELDLAGSDLGEQNWKPKQQELYLTGSNLMEAIVSVAGHKRAPAVAQALAEQDVVSLEWLQELTHAESMDLSEVVGLSRHEMLLLREAAVGIQARQLKKSSAPVETDDTSYALQPSGGVGLLNSFRSLFSLKDCICARPVTCIRPITTEEPEITASSADENEMVHEFSKANTSRPKMDQTLPPTNLATKLC